jgi:hypothetical protein
VAGKQVNRHVRIGPFDFQVLSDPDTDRELLEAGDAGASDTLRLTIKVRSDLPAAVRHETLVHEVLHCILSVTHYGSELAEQDEERLVRTLAPHLAELGLLADRFDDV